MNTTTDFDDDFDDGEPEYTPEQRAQAKADLDRYCKALMEPVGWRTGLAIEKHWDLDGLPPSMVTATLAQIAGAREDDLAF